MSQKRETVFRNNVHKHLPKGFFRQGNGAGGFSANGVPDVYYDGPRADLWVEYKFNPVLPRSGVVVGGYTKLQLQWMTRRYNNCRVIHCSSRNVVGIVGLPGNKACIQVTPYEWENGTPLSEAVPNKEVAHWIAEYCGVSSKPDRPS